MNRKPEMELTEGSEYKILSLGGRNNVLETQGIFKGFSSLGIDEVALLIELGKKHGEMKGKTRIIPLNVILAIDVLEAKPNRKKDEGRETSHYVG